MALLVIAGVAGLPPAFGQTGSPFNDGLVLRLSPMLEERLPPDAGKKGAVTVFGDAIRGKVDVETVIEGHAELRRRDLVLRADRITHVEDSDTALASGNVRINRGGNIYQGTELQLKLDTNEGHFLQPRFSFLRNGGQGDAERVDFIDDDHSVAHRVIYSTCERPPGSKWMPDWWVSARTVEFDNEEEVGTAINGVLNFKGVPILASPYLTFPLSNRRKSGVLPPTINIDNLSGVEVTLPYYLNLAPDHDATLYPTLMSRRGVELGGEFRYLDPAFKGEVRATVMPSDRLRDEDRWSLSAQHQQSVRDVPGLGHVGLRLNLNRVSDDRYWSDFPRSGKVLTQRLLPTEAVASWGWGPWSVSAGHYTFQALNAPAPLLPPFNRVPSVAARYFAPPLDLGALSGIDASLFTEVTRFERDSVLASNQDGSRALLVGQLGKTWQTPGGYLRPSLQLHARQYQFDRALPDRAGQGQAQQGMVLPTVSLDGGLFFERDARILGRDFVQTLEPRVVYSRTPYRDQSWLPAYDSAPFDYNLATVYLPNPFAGNDRLADLHALTVGVTSRVLDPDTGEEVFSLGIAERLRLSDQRITLGATEPAVPSGPTDLLVGARYQWSRRWAATATTQYNPETHESARTTLGLRYNPGDYRVLNLGYRYKGAPVESKQVELGWQWPLQDLFGSSTARMPGRALGPQQWYSVGRINYSVTDGKVVDLLAGFEYDAGCWVARMILDRMQNNVTSTSISNGANMRVIFQIEFTGFTSLGSNPLQKLRENVPRYQFLREEVNPPSRFERYE
jgi:LPS-assembly protein